MRKSTRKGASKPPNSSKNKVVHNNKPGTRRRRGAHHQMTRQKRQGSGGRGGKQKETLNSAANNKVGNPDGSGLEGSGEPVPVEAEASSLKLNLGLLNSQVVVIGAPMTVYNQATLKPARLVLVGCGGTGSFLAGGLARLAWELRRTGWGVELEFWDFDRVEEKNIPRQAFMPGELGMYKAQALALRYSAVWGLEIKAFLKPFEGRLYQRRDYYGVGDPLTVIVGAVDNAAARRQMAETLKGNNTLNPRNWWLDCGNAHSSCQILLGTHNQVEELEQAFHLGCNALPSPALQHPELLIARPEELNTYYASAAASNTNNGSTARLSSCAELVAANIQSMTINKLTASLAEDMLLRLLTGKLHYFALYADQESGTMKARYTDLSEVARVIGKPTQFFVEKKN